MPLFVNRRSRVFFVGFIVSGVIAGLLISWLNTGGSRQSLLGIITSAFYDSVFYKTFMARMREQRSVDASTDDWHDRR
jgi:hypothetical protein